MIFAHDHLPSQAGNAHRHPEVDKTALAQMPSKSFRTRRRANDHGQVFKSMHHDDDIQYKIHAR